MKNDSVLTVTSLLSVVLFGLHLTSDIYFGKEQGNLQDYIGGTVIAVVLAYSTLVLTWRWARVVVLVGGLFTALMPALHMNSGVGGDFAKSPGGYFFIWTLFAMGLTGSLSFILSIRGLLASRSARSQ